jgi:2-polyprenyl-6-methoxyphenol hydroxylase-like FAD-dependent oxidoreductase
MGADSQAIYRPDGTLTIEFQLPRIGGPDFPATMGMKRSSLHQILTEAVRAAGVQVRCATTAQDWQDGEAGIDVQFSDGTDGRYALLVGADGISSATRSRLWPDITPELARQIVWRAETPRPPELTRTQVYVNNSEKCVVGIVPLSDDTSYIYIGQESDDDSYRDDSTLDVQMRDLLGGFGGMVERLAPTIDHPGKVSCRPVNRMLVPAPWHRGRVVIIGDAAHVHSPSLAQGAAMGIEDAIVLAEEVSKNPEDIAAALEAFNERRYARVAAVVDASTRLGGEASDAELAEIRKGILTLLAQPI